MSLRLRHRVLNAMILLTLLACIAAVGYVVTATPASEPFTEFYLLGQGGKAADYPKEMSLGEEARVTVGVVNHEHRVVSYRVQIVMAGKASQELGPLSIADGQKWEGQIALVPQQEGSQQIEFLLYEVGATNALVKPLFLNVNVKAG